MFLSSPCVCTTCISRPISTRNQALLNPIPLHVHVNTITTASLLQIRFLYCGFLSCRDFWIEYEQDWTKELVMTGTSTLKGVSS